MLRAADVLWSVMKEDCFTSIYLKDAYFYILIVSHQRKKKYSNQFQEPGLPIQGPTIRSVSGPSCLYEVNDCSSIYPLWSRSKQILPYLDDWQLCAHKMANCP